MKVIIIGGGPGGYTAAIRFAQEGADVTLVEKENIGGVCLNKGCIPAKLLLHAASVKAEAEQAKEWGVKTGNISFDWKSVLARKEASLTKLRNGIEGLLAKAKVSVLKGSAVFESTSSIIVKKADGSQESISFDKCVIATGASDVKPVSIIEDEENVYTGTEIFSIKQLPESIIVIGGGVVGCELATALAQYGVKVTILEYTHQILNGFDQKQVNVIIQHLIKNGVEIHANCKVETVSDEWGRKSVTYKQNCNSKEVSADAVLMAMGRKPNIEGLNLEAVGVEVDNNRIKVNENLETSLKNVYAIGDCASKIQLEYVATNEAQQLVEYVMKGTKTEEALIPACVYTTPEIARIGADENSENAIAAEFPFSANGRALSCGCTEGSIKIIADKYSHKVIGASIVGQSATELISICTMAIKAGMTLEDISKIIFPHPVLAEGIKEASMMLIGNSVNFTPVK